MSYKNSEVLKSILKWSIQQQKDESTNSKISMSPERQKWLSDALADICSQPSETDILKAAITVLKVHYEISSEDNTDENTTDRLIDTFDQVQYLIEDLDHANDLISLGAVDIIIQYISHQNQDLVRAACEIIATASQNNTNCQQAFFSAVAKLSLLVQNEVLSDGVRIKALYAISCLTRDFAPGQKYFLENDGLSILIKCMNSGISKLIIKSLFLVSHYYASGKERILVDKLDVLISQLLHLLESCREPDMLRQITSLLGSICRSCKEADINFVDALKEKSHQLGLADELKDEIGEIARSTSH